MAELEVVDLDKEDYEFALNNLVNYGGESNITPGRARNTIFKIFDYNYLEIGNRREKKESKIKLLAQADREFEIPFFPKLLSILTYENEFIGYEMSFNSNDMALDVMSDYLSRGEMIEVLKQVKEYILFLHKHPFEIVFGDLCDTNILFDESSGNISLCDIDNVSISGMGFEAMRNTQFSYLEHNRFKITPQLDVYMHNILTRDLIFGCDSLDPLVKKYVRYKPKGFLIDEL